MNTPFNVTSANPAPVEKKKRGCLFYGCLSFLILSVLVLGGGSYLTYRAVQAVYLQYTDETPHQLPRAEGSATEYRAAKDRVSAFVEAIQSGSHPSPLHLSATEVNTLLASYPGLEEFKNTFYIQFEGSSVKGAVSIPVAQRYLNGEGTFLISWENGAPALRVEELRVRGASMPEEVMSQVRGQNLLEGAVIAPEYQQLLANIETVRVVNGHLEIVPKKVD